MSVSPGHHELEKTVIYAHERHEKKTTYVGPRPGFPKQALDLWPAMEAYLAKRELNALTARINGWYPSRYQGAPRIIIPCSNTAGVPYFQGRAMSKGDGAQLRYASPPASRDDSIVVVWPEVRARQTVIVEGPMCALAAADQGCLGVALMGNAPTREVLSHVISLVRPFAPVTIIPDVDMLEFGPTILCAIAQAGIPTMIRVPARKDLADMTLTERKSFLQ